ncbi:MAG: hypothetical protein IOC39_29215 [Burkholderia sp.]|uniref:hypothetical protein n=1 Tax=Burkholderia TaxID=32008 RepID=UPI001CA41A62|nr:MULTISPECIES: hypothetical protein [Burkholderia]MBY8606079.1 hypothetical protein [Burkholderia arboris]MCA3782423.1 hypothetical protein [Burkholderia sp.]MCA3789435.1 hypothetical protein [Burkholderia sp.]MCA3793384.1 hypothetical protein [Burkholderia sp.]MCA3806638.1 hypothetical protein [Burkholderia sp.]
MKTNQMFMKASAPADIGPGGWLRIAVPFPQPCFVAPFVPDGESSDSAPPTPRARPTGRA